MQKISKTDFKDYLVAKPWGCEHIAYQNKVCCVGLLKINYNEETSLHCHPNKKTGLIVVKGKVKIEAKLDLHGYNLIESEERVYNFVRQKYESNIRLIQIITGKGKRLSVGEGWKGTGKLKENLPSWLRSPAISDKIVWFDKAPANKGGDGAFLVYLKKKSRV